MSIMEISERVNKLANAWENFKSVNDKKLVDIEKKGKYDPLYDEQLRKINSDLDIYKDKLSNIEVMIARPEKAINCSTNDPYSYAFNEYLRKGIENNLLHYEKKSLSVGSETDGGYFVTPAIATNLTQSITEISPMRQLASIENISTDSLDVIEDFGSLSSGWTSETATIEETETPKIRKKKIQVHELYAQPKATQKLIDDASIDIEKWLGDKLLHSFANMENSAFIYGDGIGKPRGILSYTAGKEWGEIEEINSGINGELTAESLFDLYFALKEQYASRAVFLMHKTIIQKIRMLKDKNNQYLWHPGLDKASPATLLGLPVKHSVDMPLATEGSISIALADFKLAYKIVDRKGIKILRDPFTEKPFVKFYATKRVGGDIVNYEAIKLLKLNK